MLFDSKKVQDVDNVLPFLLGCPRKKRVLQPIISLSPRTGAGLSTALNITASHFCVILIPNELVCVPLVTLVTALLRLVKL
jgi:hypothetical protein